MKPSYGLTDGEIASMIKDSMSYAEQDVQARMLAEQKLKPRAYWKVWSARWPPTPRC